MFVATTMLEYWRRPHALTGWWLSEYMLFPLLWAGVAGYIWGLWVWKTIEHNAS
jgi:hypothetical protein